MISDKFIQKKKKKEFYSSWFKRIVVVSEQVDNLPQIMT